MNRFYNPSAPRYTSQFVEKQLPLDLMVGFAQQKQQQQSAFMQSIGALQGEAAMIPNGLRTEDMAPLVRQKWTSNITDWQSKNINNYDSPTAIAELAKLHSMFQADPDVNIMKKDAKDSENYMREKIRSGASDYDPNVMDRRTGKLFQFEMSQPGRPAVYTPYDPIIQDPKTANIIINEFSTIKPQETTTSYLRKDVVDGQEVWREGRTSTSVTPQDLYAEKFNNFVNRGLEQKEQWAVYENALFKERTGRDMTAEDWANFIRPISEPTIRRDFADVANWNMPSGGTGKSSDNAIDLGPLATDMTEKPDAYKKATAKTLNQAKRIKDAPKQDPNLYNLFMKFSNDPEHSARFNSLPNDRKKIEYIKDNDIKESTKRKVFTRLDPFTKEVEQEINRIFMGKPNDEGWIKISAAGTLLKGQPIVETSTGRMLQEEDKKNLASGKDTFVRALGRTSKDMIGRAPMPGLIMFERKSGNDTDTYQVQIPNYADAERPSWDLLSMMRSNTGIGDGSIVTFSFTNDGRPLNPTFTDSQNSHTDIKNVDANEINSFYLQPMIDHTDNGRPKIKVYSRNPYVYYNKTGNVGEMLFNNEASDIYLGEYYIDENPQSPHSATNVLSNMINDARQLLIGE